MALRPHQPPRSLLRATFRLFSTTPQSLTRPTRHHPPRLPSAPPAAIPPYPYPAATWYKQSNHGLYGTSRIQFGNTVSERTEIKNRRRWAPNIRHKRLWSAALQRWLRLKVQARVLRTIDKVGGLDAYLLGEKEARVRELGVEGWRLRWRVMMSGGVRRRWEGERGRLGVLGEEGGEAVRAQVEEFDRGLDERGGEVLLGEGGVDESLGEGFVREEEAPEGVKVKL